MNTIKRLICLAFCLIFAFAIVGCTGEKFFDAKDGSITVLLDSSFKEIKRDESVLYLESRNCVFNAVKEDKASLQSTMFEFEKIDEYQYATIWLEVNKIVADVKQQEGTKNYYFEFEKDGAYSYVVPFRGSDAYYLCQFICVASEKETYKPKFVKWSQQILFN